MGGTAADHIDLSVHSSRIGVVPRSWHRTPGFPLIGFGIVRFIRAKRSGGSVKEYGRGIRALISGAANDVDFVAAHDGNGRTALRRQRGDCFPGIGSGVVFPRVVRGPPSPKSLIRHGIKSE